MNFKKFIPYISLSLAICMLASCTQGLTHGEEIISEIIETTQSLVNDTIASEAESTDKSSDIESAGTESMETEGKETEGKETEGKDTEGTASESTSENDPFAEDNSNDAYYIIEAVAQYGRNGLANGWKYDNRFELSNSTGVESNMLYDTSDEKFYRLIRDFSAENNGILKLEMIVSAKSGEEGIYIAMCAADDEKVFYLTPKDGKWVFVGESELVTPIAIDNGAATQNFGIEMNIDLDNNTADVTINNVYCGSINIADKALERLILGTNKVGVGTIGFSYVRLIKNYPVVDRFILGDVADFEGQAPANWSVNGDFKLARIKSMRLYDMYSVVAESNAGDVSSAKKSFKKTGGTVSMEAMILLPEKTDGASVSFMSGDEKIITFMTRDGGKIYVGDVMVNDYIANVWQTLHVDADTNTGKAKIYVNGKHKATVDIDCDGFDGVSIDFAPTTDATMWFDDVEIYEIIKHANYPSTPVVSESTDYNIGMNVCWLWRDQQSGEGWDATSPFMEFDTFLGYYDEGMRETADWELKWMAEHGIDFVHVCWYAPSGDLQAPIKEMRHSYSALHDGYMMAEYSNLVDFCIMWENQATDCHSFEQFREYIWNYWCEYYFSDTRYARLDNKAVITVWDISNFAATFGGIEQSIAAMDWMEQELRDKYGYDGMIFLVSSQTYLTAAQYVSIANRGFDGTYAYHWGEDGWDATYQVKCNQANLNRAQNAGIHHIPTVSIGFNDVGRNETRSPIISVSDHKKVCGSIKNLVNKLNTGTWKDNTIFLSTWNEYSEGTYMFPTESTGFDYLENVRDTFTSDKADHEELHERPTENQIERINRLYPKNYSPIRWYQFEKASSIDSKNIVNVNGVKMTFTFNPEIAADGDFIVVGEAKGRGFYSMMRLFYEWDRYTDDGVLTLHSYLEHTYVFKVGSDKVLVDGVEQDLGFTFTLRDGLPQFHLKKLCDLLGYKYTQTGTTIKVQACSDEEYEHLKNLASEAWEFNILGELQGWKTQQGSSVTGADGTLVVTPTGNDVAVIRSVDFKSYQYNVIKIGVKYNAEFMKQNPYLYFTTTQNKEFGICVVGAKYDIEGKKEGDIVELVFNMESSPYYVGTITQIRFDPFTGMFPVEIDYIRCEFDEDLALENNVTYMDDENQWEFAADHNDLGWEGQNSTELLEVFEGFMRMKAFSEDPYIAKDVNFRASKYQVLIVRMKYKSCMEDYIPELYFKTTSGTYWDESRVVSGIVRIREGVVEGDVVDVIFDLSLCENWKGTITGLRFDPFNTDGVFEIESINLYQKRGNEMTGEPATKPTQVVITDVANVPSGIEIGTSKNAEIKVVDDPTNPENKVFKVECVNGAGGNTVYTYFNLFMQFEPGETYVVSYKLMPLTDYNGNSFENTTIGGNIMYGTTANTAIAQHLFDNKANKSTSDEWIELTFTVKIPANYTANDGDCFQIWGKFAAESGCGISYLVKDVSITLDE